MHIIVYNKGSYVFLIGKSRMAEYLKGERMRTSERILQEVKKAVIGKDELLEKILMAILANGHILMEDMPGVGKTTIARAFADAMQLDCRRMQFTVGLIRRRVRHRYARGQFLPICFSLMKSIVPPPVHRQPYWR